MLQKLQGKKRWIAGLLVVLYYSLRPVVTGQMVDKAGQLGHGDLQGVLILFLCYSIMVFAPILMVSMLVKAFWPKKVQGSLPGEENL